MRRENRQVWNALMLVLQFGLNMIIPIFACTFAGIWLDKRLGTSWLVILFFFVGALAGFTGVWRMSKKLMKNEGRDRSKNHVTEKE